MIAFPKKTGKPYRLPSESEWEYACRADTETPFHCGETISTYLANYRGTDWIYEGTICSGSYGKGVKGIYRGQTTDVGSLSPNAFGLYDMHGNVWEWCSDLWHDNYDRAPCDGSVWGSGNREHRLLRGGSWFYHPRSCRSANRVGSTPEDRNCDFGFRVVCPFPKAL